MLKFWFHKYTLQPLTQIGALADANPREGALLRIQWPDGKIGYADLFPWPELHDADLETQLMAIGRGKLSALVEQAIWLAHRDAKARDEKRNAYQNLTKVKNHFLISDPSRVEAVTLEDIRIAGYTTIKVKIGRNPKEEVKFLERIFRQYKFMVRLDFNSSMLPKDFETFVKWINPGFRPRIEYAEDPFPYDEQEWRKANDLLPLALDHEYDKVDWARFGARPPFKFLVVKPARQDVGKAMENAERFDLKVAVTSSLDHPVGVAHAVWVAGELKASHPNTIVDCGCLTLRNYKGNDFSSSVIIQGPYWSENRGNGIGFDLQLGNLSWTAITYK